MKKLLAVFVSLFVFAPAVLADNWGVGVKLGAGENDPKALKELSHTAWSSTELTEGDGFMGLEVLYEWNLAPKDQIGVKLGLDWYNKNELELGDPFNDTFKETTFVIPLTAYYKRNNGVQALSYFGGVGISFINTKMKDSDGDSDDKSKVFPHITVGAEYRFTEVFALGLDLKYNIAAKVEKDGDVYSDRSGFNGALAARFYF